jgi:hypothetical protein
VRLDHLLSKERPWPAVGGFEGSLSPGCGGGVLIRRRHWLVIGQLRLSGEYRLCCGGGESWVVVVGWWRQIPCWVLKEQAFVGCSGWSPASGSHTGFPSGFLGVGLGGGGVVRVVVC